MACAKDLTYARDAVPRIFFTAQLRPGDVVKGRAAGSQYILDVSGRVTTGWDRGQSRPGGIGELKLALDRVGVGLKERAKRVPGERDAGGAPDDRGDAEKFRDS